MPCEDPHCLVCLATASNPFQAHIWQQALEREGIRCQVVGDYLEVGIGDIPGMMAEVWGEAADATRAAAILHQHQGVNQTGFSTGQAREFRRHHDRSQPVIHQRIGSRTSKNGNRGSSRGR